MADNKVTVELELVDKISKQLDGITGRIESLEKTSAKGFEKAGSAFTIFEGVFAEHLVEKALDGIAEAGKKLFETVLEAETIRAVSVEFEILTKNAGLAGDALREKLIGAAGGLIDDTDLIHSANKAIVELGGNAAKIPEVLELARKVTAVFGGDVRSNFEQLNAAIAGGQQRALKSLGIIIDSDKAYRDYARSIGVSVDVLSQAGKQQAFLNATLEAGARSLKGVNPELKENTTEYQRLKVALEQASEAGTLALGKIAGPAVNTALKATTGFIKEMTDEFQARYSTGAEQAASKISLLKGALEELERIKSGEKFSIAALIPGATDAAIKKAREELALLEEVERKRSTQSRQDAKGSESPKIVAVDAEADRKLRAENAKKIAADEIASQGALIDAKHAAEQTNDAIYYEQKKAIEHDRFSQDLADLDKQLSDRKLSPAEFRKSEENAERKHAASLLAIENEKHKKLLSDRDNFLSLTISLSNAKSKELAAIGKAAALVQIAIDTERAVSGAYAFGSTIGGPILGAIFGGIAFTAEAARAANVVGIELNSGVDSVPGIGNTDSVPARLTPGEAVLTTSDNKRLRSYVDSNEGNAQHLAAIRGLLERGRNVNVYVGDREVAAVVRDSIHSGRVIF